MDGFRKTVSKKDLEHYRNFRGKLGEREAFLKTIRKQCKPEDYSVWNSLTEEEKQEVRANRNYHPKYYEEGIKYYLMVTILGLIRRYWHTNWDKAIEIIKKCHQYAVENRP